MIVVLVVGGCLGGGGGGREARLFGLEQLSGVHGCETPYSCQQCLLYAWKVLFVSCSFIC